MISHLIGDDFGQDDVRQCIGQRIEKAELSQPEYDEQSLLLHLESGVLRLWDDGQSCCEARYMVCDDDLEPIAGETLKDIEVAEGPTVEEHGEPKECQFLRVITDGGTYTVANYNEHNGYYGGFALTAKFAPKGE